MNLGLFLPTMWPHGTPSRDVVAAAQHAEQLGYESIWAVDQLVAGTGTPIVDSTVALAAAAGATDSVLIGYGVLIAPLRPPVWAAKQAASLQLVSGGRVLLGIGAGGDRHARSWEAAGVPRRERGSRTDRALAVLADLIAGREVAVEGRAVQLAPGVAVPPILVGGASDVALARTVAAGDGWFGLPIGRDPLAAVVARLRELADQAGRAMPTVTGSIMVSLSDDPDSPDDDGIAAVLTDPDGMFGVPPEGVPGMVVRTSAALAERLAMWEELGSERVVITIAAGDWYRQAALIADAVGVDVRRDPG